MTSFIGGIIYNVLLTGKNIAQAAYALPGTIKNGVSTYAKDTLNATAKSLQNRAGHLVKDSVRTYAPVIKEKVSNAIKTKDNGPGDGVALQILDTSVASTIDYIANAIISKASEYVTDNPELIDDDLSKNRPVEQGSRNALAQVPTSTLAASMENYADLSFRITSIGDKIITDIRANQPVSQVNRNELAEKLEAFVKLPSLKQEDKEFIIFFCNALKDSNVVFDKEKAAASFLVLQPYFAPYKKYMDKKVAEQMQLEKALGLISSASSKPAPVKLNSEEIVKGIDKQIDLLKSNTIKMILGTSVLQTLGISTSKELVEALEINYATLEIARPDENTNIVNYLIDVSNKIKSEGNSSEEVFQGLLYKIICNSDLDIFTFIWAMVKCYCLFGTASSIVGNLCDNLKKELVNFAKLSPAEQLEQVTQLLINPLIDHLDKKTISSDKASGVGKEILSSAANLLPSRPLVQGAQFGINYLLGHADIQTQFIKAFLAKFIDETDMESLRWTRTERATCVEKASHSDSSVEKAGWTMLALWYWFLGKLKGGICHSPINITMHLIKTLIAKLCPNLTTAPDLHSLKKTLLTALQQARLTALLPRTDDPTYLPPKEAPEVKKQIAKVLDKLLKELRISDVTEEELSALVIFIINNAHGIALKDLKNIIKNAVADLLVNMFAQEDSINKILLSSLTSANTSGFSSTKAPLVSQEELNKEKENVEIELQKELELLGPSILQAVNNATRTDKRSQYLANIHITVLKNHVEAFNKKLLEISSSPASFKEHGLEACERFQKSMDELKTEITNSVDEDTQKLLMPQINTANDHVRLISANLSQSIEHKANKAVPIQDEFNHKKIESTLASAAQFAESAKELQFVKVKTEPTSKDAFMTLGFNLDCTKNTTSGVIQAYAGQFFEYIGKKENIGGIAQRTMNACIPLMKPKERQVVGFLPNTQVAQPIQQ